MTDLGVLGAFKAARANLDAKNATREELRTRSREVIFDRLTDLFGDGAPAQRLPFFDDLAANMALSLQWGGVVSPSGELPLRFSPRIDPSRTPGSDANQWTVKYNLDVPSEKLVLELSFDRWASRMMGEQRSAKELLGIMTAPPDGAGETESRRFASAMVAAFGTVQESVSFGTVSSENERRHLLGLIGAKLANAFGAPADGVKVQLETDGALNLRVELQVPGVKKISAKEAGNVAKRDHASPNGAPPGIP